MSKKSKARRSLAEILASTSDVLFPDQRGQAPIDINSVGYDDDTPLHVLLWRGDHYGVQLLIDEGANINAIGDMGETPLHMALRKEDHASCLMLVKAGAKFDVRSELGQTPRELADELGGNFAELHSYFDA